MELQKNTKIWLLTLLKVFLKDGKKLKYKNYLKFIYFNLIKEYKDLNLFFFDFYKKLFFPFYFRTRVVAGRKVIIPSVLSENKEIFYIVKFIKNIIKNRSERFFKDKLLSELKDIYLDNNQSLTKKKIEVFYKEVQINFVNLRFIRVFK